LLTLAVLAVIALGPPRADGAIKIYESSKEAPLLGKIKSGNCRVRGKGGDRYFRASAKSTNRKYELEVTILQWSGYGEEYSLAYGTNKPGVFYLDGPSGPFSNIFADKAPGVPAGGLGFASRDSKMSVGFLPAPNRSNRKGVVLAGTMNC
jgi:hypothetical protein